MPRAKDTSMMIERAKEIRKQCMKPKGNKEHFEEQIKSLAPGKYPYYESCEMNTKEKNLWIIGEARELERFVYKAIGPEFWRRVYVKNEGKNWDEYEGQPFILFRLYSLKNRPELIEHMQIAGDHVPHRVQTQWGNEDLVPDLYHTIVLSNYTPKEYCKGLKESERKASSLEWRYDILYL